MNETCPTCGRIDGATRPHLLLDSEELCPRGAPGDYPPDDPADLEGREEWGREESNSGDPGEWAEAEPDDDCDGLPEVLPGAQDGGANPVAAGFVAVLDDDCNTPSSVAGVESSEVSALSSSTPPKAKRGRKAKASAEPVPDVEPYTTTGLAAKWLEHITSRTTETFPMLCPVESCRSEVAATFDGERLVLADHVHPQHNGRCACVVVPRKHWPAELTRAALERAGEWMVGDAEPFGAYAIYAPTAPDNAAPGTWEAIRDAMVARALEEEIDPAEIRPLSTSEPDPAEGTGDVWAEVEAFCDDLSEVSLSPADDIDAAWREHYAIRYPGSIASPSVRISKEVLMRGEVKPAEPWPVMDLGRGVIAAGDHESDATAVLAAELALSGILSALGVSDLNDAHRRIDAMRQAEKGLEQILTAAGEGATAVGVARELGRKPEPVTAEPKNTLSLEAPRNLDVWLMQVGGNPPEATFSAVISKDEAQRLGKSPGLYGRVRVVLPVEGEGE